MIFITKVNDNHIVCPHDGFITRSCSPMAIHIILQRHTSSSVNNSWRACSGPPSICRGASGVRVALVWVRLVSQSEGRGTPFKIPFASICEINGVFQRQHM